MHSRAERERLFHDVRYSSELRSEVDQLYSVLEAGRHEFRRLVQDLSAEKRVLEMGCGKGAKMIDICANARSGIAIDISPIAVERARSNVDDPRWDFQVMDATATTFDPESFDIIIGTGVVHHLDVDLAMAEIRRLLAPGGAAIFLEPLGHNPILNLYRSRTPEFRSADERPLRRADFFQDGLSISVHQYGLISAALGLLKFGDGSVAHRLCSFELRLLHHIPIMKWAAWYALIRVTRLDEDV
ncbi:MAG: class I SAM-dependent methyltransferase [Acidimicrobiales bacterium]